MRDIELLRALERRANASPRKAGHLNIAGVSPAWKAVLALGAVVLTALVTLTLGCVVQCNWYHFRSEAMEPSVHRGQWIWTRPVGTVHQGEMVLLTPPPPLHPDYLDDVLPPPRLVLTRIIAVAGETVSIADGRLQIDGRPANEPYLRPGTTTPTFAPTKVPAGTVYVLGDHRENAAGSFTYGPVPLRQVKERLVWVGAPAMELLASATVILALAYIVLVNAALRRSPD